MRAPGGCRRWGAHLVDGGEIHGGADARRAEKSAKSGSAEVRLRLAAGAGGFYKDVRRRGQRGGPGWVGPGGALPGRAPPARPARHPAGTRGEAGRRPGGECPWRGVGWGVSAQFSTLETEARGIELGRGGGRAPGGTDLGRGQEGVRGRDGRGRRETRSEKEPEMERPKENNILRDREGETHTGRRTLRG